MYFDVEVDWCLNTGDTLDIHEPGTYTKVYEAGYDEEILSVTVQVLVLSDYYETVAGLYGSALEDALRTLLQETVVLQTYGDARYILQEADRDPDNPDNVLLIYTRDSVEGTWIGTEDRLWEREHVWPHSRLGEDLPRPSNTSRNISTDLHNLRAIDPGVNQSRSNKYFDETTTSLSYYPGDEDRGDVARIFFYMALMYEALELINDVPAPFQMAMLDVLIDWHTLDPVDDFERHRNDVIASYQGNRNPFIDYPLFYQLIHFYEDFMLFEN